MSVDVMAEEHSTAVALGVLQPLRQAARQAELKARTKCTTRCREGLAG